MRCAKCGADNREGRKFCTQCGSPLAAKCPRCDAAIEPAEKFCGDCGVALGASPAAAPRKPDELQIRMADTPAPESLEGERKTVTALFADIKGSTPLRATGRRPAFAKPSRSRRVNPRNGGSCARQLVSRDCCTTPIAAMRRAQSSPTSTTGSPRGSALPT
jgi:hypothetical protein